MARCSAQLGILTRWIERSAVHPADRGGAFGKLCDKCRPGRRGCVDSADIHLDFRPGDANVVDPITIPKLNQLLATRTISPTEVQDAFKVFVGRSAKAPFKSIDELLRAPGFAKVFPYAQDRLRRTSDDTRYYRFLRAQDELMTNFMKVLADNKLDAIVYKSVEHQPTLIKDGVNPPFVNTKGVPHLNTFLVFVPAIAVPAGFTADNLPAGITFMGRPYEEGTMLKLAYGYEQGTHHRKPTQTTPGLPGQP